MVAEKKNTLNLPTNLAEFINWEPNDGFKYEWNDGELIKFTGMNKTQVYIYDLLNTHFIKRGFWELGTLISEYDVMLTGIQMRRPDIAYLTKEQIQLGKNGEDVIPAFVIEIISETDQAYKIESKLIEYFKAGMKVVWLIYPDAKLVKVYTSEKTVKICSDTDICSASPILPAFEISVNELFV